MIFSEEEEKTIQMIEGLLLIIETKTRIKIVKKILESTCVLHEETIRRHRQETYRNKKVIEEAMRPQFCLITKLSLGAGDLIKLKGTRDHGVRIIRNFEGNKVYCDQLKYTSILNWCSHSQFVESYRHTGIRTKHDISKITHVAKNGEWKDLRNEWFRT